MKKYSKILLTAVVIISLFGTLMIYSSSYVWAEYKFNDPYKYIKSHSKKLSLFNLSRYIQNVLLFSIISILSFILKPYFSSKYSRKSQPTLCLVFAYCFPGFPSPTIMYIFSPPTTTWPDFPGGCFPTSKSRAFLTCPSYRKSLSFSSPAGKFLRQSTVQAESKTRSTHPFLYYPHRKFRHAW